MTVAQLTASMPASELTGWMAYRALRREDADK